MHPCSSWQTTISFYIFWGKRMWRCRWMNCRSTYNWNAIGVGFETAWWCYFLSLSLSLFTKKEEKKITNSKREWKNRMKTDFKSNAMQMYFDLSHLPGRERRKDAVDELHQWQWIQWHLSLKQCFSGWMDVLWLCLCLEHTLGTWMKKANCVNGMLTLIIIHSSTGGNKNKGERIYTRGEK